MNRGTHANQHKHTAASIGMVWLPQFAEVWPDLCNSSVASVKNLCSRWHQAHQMRNPSSASDTFSRSQDEVGDVFRAAKAGDPVFRDINDGIERQRRTGSPPEPVIGRPFGRPVGGYDAPQ